MVEEWACFSLEQTVAFDPEGETEVEGMDEGKGCPTQRALGFRHTPHIPSPFWDSSPTGRQAVSK